MPEVAEVTAGTLAARLAEGTAGYIVDVREPSEFATGSIPGAISMPVAEIRSRHYEIPRGATVHLLCANGARSLELVAFMRAVGYDARSVAGGMWAWLDHHRTDPTAGLAPHGPASPPDSARQIEQRNHETP